MTAIRIAVTAEHIATAGPWPRTTSTTFPQGWQNPVELAIAERAGVDVDVDGDKDEWHATIGYTAATTLVVDLPGAKDQLDAYWEGAEMEPFEFTIELDDWLVGMVHEAIS